MFVLLPLLCCCLACFYCWRPWIWPLRWMWPRLGPDPADVAADGPGAMVVAVTVEVAVAMDVAAEVDVTVEVAVAGCCLCCRHFYFVA